MKDRKGINRLKVLINKIAVDANNMELVAEIIQGLSEDCNVVPKSVRRWLNNKSQPSSGDLTRIILYLNKYNPSISYADFFEPNVSDGTKINVSPRFKLVK
jgi:hypothetical protein